MNETEKVREISSLPVSKQGMVLTGELLLNLGNTLRL